MGEVPLTGGVLTWEEWREIYHCIVADFDFDPAADRAARDELGDLVGPDALGLDELPDATGKTVAVAGAAPGLSDEAAVAADADLVLAASGAAGVLEGAGVSVDVIVTDLDGAPATTATLSQDGTVVAVHGHGDNRPQLREWLPSIAANRRFPTTQHRPTDRVANVGGFTDGDRAAFLATAIGADRLTFPGWAFDDPAVSSIKRRKLRWAERLLHWLERRRGDRFPVLDGRRTAIDIDPFPNPKRT